MNNDTKLLYKHAFDSAVMYLNKTHDAAIAEVNEKADQQARQYNVIIDRITEDAKHQAEQNGATVAQLSDDIEMYKSIISMLHTKVDELTSKRDEETQGDSVQCDKTQKMMMKATMLRLQIAIRAHDEKWGKIVVKNLRHVSSYSFKINVTGSGSATCQICGKIPIESHPVCFVFDRRYGLYQSCSLPECSNLVKKCISRTKVEVVTCARQTRKIRELLGAIWISETFTKKLLVLLQSRELRKCS